MSRKSCLNCTYGSKVLNTGACEDDFVKPYRIACAIIKDIEEYGKNYLWNEYYMSDNCRCYEPKLVDCCAYCKSKINAPEYNWQIWAGIDGKAVCSHDCRVKLEAAEIGNLFYD